MSKELFALDMDKKERKVDSKENKNYRQTHRKLYHKVKNERKGKK